MFFFYPRMPKILIVNSKLNCPAWEKDHICYLFFSWSASFANLESLSGFI